MIKKGNKYLVLGKTKIEIIDNLPFVSWNQLEARKRNIRILFKFQCNFETCKGKCCRGCANNGGYLKMVNSEHTKIYQKLWDNKTGFHTETGCLLPDYLRSITCLSHTCDYTLSDAIYNYLKTR